MPNRKIYLLSFLAAVAISATDGARYKQSYAPSSHHDDKSYYRSHSQCEASCHDPGSSCKKESYGPYKWCCAPVDCGDPVAPEHGEVFTPYGTHNGKQAIYLCAEGYHLIGGPNPRTCLASGIWSGTPPACRAECDRLEDPEHGDVTLSGTEEGDTASYDCDTGYEISSGTNPRTCGSTGIWSGIPVECSRVVCTPLSDPEHGYVEMPDGHSFEDEAIYHCDPGYEIDGIACRTCRSNGHWSGQEPECKPKDCGELQDPNHGDVTYTTTDLDSEAHYECDEGYDLVGDDTRTCLEGGWSGLAPYCELVVCPELEHPLHGNVRNPGGPLFGNLAYYSCFGEPDDGCFELSDDTPRRCLQNGTWSGENRTCDTKTEAYSGDLFYFFTCIKSWELAQDFCEDLGGDLVTIPDQGTNDFLKSILNDIGSEDMDWWTGLHDNDNEDSFEWIADGNPLVGYEDWGPGQPNNFLNDEDCVRLRQNDSYRWWDRNCYRNFYFICQTES